MQATKIIACFVSVAFLGILPACSNTPVQEPSGTEQRAQTSPYVTTLLVPSTTTQAQTTAEREPVDSETLLDVFNALLDVQHINPGDLGTYIRANAKYMNEDHVSTMVATYEHIQREYRETLDSLFFDTDTQKKLADLTDQGIGFNEYDEIEDETLRVLLQDTHRAGFMVRQSEGMFYPVIDYMLYEEYAPHVSKAVRSYLALMAQETEQPFAEDGELMIDHIDVLTRAHAFEMHLREYPDFENIEQVVLLFMRYAYISFFGTDNTPIFDTQTGEMDRDVKDALAVFVERETDGEFVQALTEFQEALTASSYEWNESVQQLTEEKIEQLRSIYRPEDNESLLFTPLPKQN